MSWEVVIYDPNLAVLKRVDLISYPFNLQPIPQKGNKIEVCYDDISERFFIPEDTDDAEPGHLLNVVDVQFAFERDQVKIFTSLEE